MSPVQKPLRYDEFVSELETLLRTRANDTMLKDKHVFDRVCVLVTEVLATPPALREDDDRSS